MRHTGDLKYKEFLYLALHRVSVIQNNQKVTTRLYFQHSVRTTAPHDRLHVMCTFMLLKNSHDTTVRHVLEHMHSCREPTHILAAANHTLLFTALMRFLLIYRQKWRLTRTNKKTFNVRTNVTFRRVRVTNLALERQALKHILPVCSLSHPACKAHAPHYIFICGLFRSNILFHLTL